MDKASSSDLSFHSFSKPNYPSLPSSPSSLFPSSRLSSPVSKEIQCCDALMTLACDKCTSSSDCSHSPVSLSSHSSDYFSSHFHSQYRISHSDSSHIFSHYPLASYLPTHTSQHLSSSLSNYSLSSSTASSSILQSLSSPTPSSSSSSSSSLTNQLYIQLPALTSSSTSKCHSSLLYQQNQFYPLSPSSPSQNKDPLRSSLHSSRYSPYYFSLHSNNCEQQGRKRKLEEKWFDDGYCSFDVEREEYVQDINSVKGDTTQNENAAVGREIENRKIINGSAMIIESHDLAQQPGTVLVCRRTNACPLHRTRKKRCPAECCFDLFSVYRQTGYTANYAKRCANTKARIGRCAMLESYLCNYNKQPPL